MIQIIRTFCLFLCLFAITPSFAETPDDSQLLQDLFKKYESVSAGKNADYIPALAKQNPKLLAIAVVTTDGQVTAIGDADTAFPIESIVKPFLYILAMQDYGEKTINGKVGLNATGAPFNSIVAIEDRPDHLQNALVNAGAIQTSSFIKGKNKDVKWQRIMALLNNLSAAKLKLGTEVYQSETLTNTRNQAITALLASYNMIQGDKEEALDRYTKACSILITAKQLAVIGATLANDGINPITHKRIVDAELVKAALSQMVVNGLYEHSGAWFFKVGIPAKSGVGGGILAVVPHKLAIVAFSPPLDESGNSVRAQAIIEDYSKQKHLHLLES